MDKEAMRHMLDWWIYDYLNRRGLHQSAEAWFDELNHVVRPHVVSPSEGFLMDWWGFFWQHFNADGAPNTESSLQLTPNMINPVPISRADVVSESNVNPFPAPTSGFDEHGVLGHIHVSGVHVPPWPALNPGIMGSNNVLGNVGLPGVGVCPHVYGVIPVMNINTGLASQFNPNNISNSTPVLGLPLVPRSNIASELNMQSSGMQGQQHMGIPIGYSNIQLNLEENVFMQDPYRRKVTVLFAKEFQLLMSLFTMHLNRCHTTLNLRTLVCLHVILSFLHLFLFVLIAKFLC